MKIGFVGTSHLGINTAVGLSSKGFDIFYCLDSKEIESRWKEGNLGIFEPSLEELFEKYQRNISYSSSDEGLKDCHIVYVALDIKTTEANVSELEPIKELINKTILAMKSGSTLVIHSQVPPGFSRGFLKQAIDKEINLIYQVETLIFGRAIERVTEPERYIVGLPEKSDELPEKYNELLNSFSCPVLKMRFESSELAKISINLFLISSVSTTNMISEACENIDADWFDIKEALQLDRRIGPYAYLNPGLGISGGNLERDMVTIHSMITEQGGRSGLLENWMSDSEYYKNWVFRKLSENGFVSEDYVVGILGIAYRPNTNSIKNSPSVKLIDKLDGICHLISYDPEAQYETEGMEVASYMIEIFERGDVIVIMTPWDEFKEIDQNSITELCEGKTVIDPFGVLKDMSIPGKYITLGQKEKNDE